ncbi:hypothetical protein ABTM07_19570, partial [Acinetobacter baumannii]
VGAAWAGPVRAQKATASVPVVRPSLAIRIENPCRIELRIIRISVGKRFACLLQMLRNKN